MAKNAADVAQKWAANLGGSTAAIKSGVQGVTVAPTAAAAARQDAFIQGVQQSVASGKWQAGLSRVSLQDWQQAMLNKGLGRIGPGAAAAQGKFQSFMNQLLPFQASLQQQLAATPRGDLNQNIQRMIQWAQGMANFKRSQ